MFLLFNFINRSRHFAVGGNAKTLTDIQYLKFILCIIIHPKWRI